MYNTDYVVMYCIHEYLLVIIVIIVQIQYSVRYIQTQVSIVWRGYSKDRAKARPHVAICRPCGL